MMPRSKRAAPPAPSTRALNHAAHPHQFSRIGIDSTDPVASASAAAADNALL
jgi:hypothetical protein